MVFGNKKHPRNIRGCCWAGFVVVAVTLIRATASQNGVGGAVLGLEEQTADAAASGSDFKTHDLESTADARSGVTDHGVVF